MAELEPLEEEHGVSVLVVEDWPHHRHSGEGPLTKDVKHKASVPGQVAAENRKVVVGQSGVAGMTSHERWGPCLAAEMGWGAVPGQAVQGGLKDTLVRLHGLWGEGHCGEGMGAAAHTHFTGFHFKDVNDTVDGLRRQGRDQSVLATWQSHLPLTFCPVVTALFYKLCARDAPVK